MADGVAAPIGAGRVTDRELYDLRRDPYELENLARDRAYADARAALAALTARLRACSGADCAVSASVPGPVPGAQ